MVRRRLRGLAQVGVRPGTFPGNEPLAEHRGGDDPQHGWPARISDSEIVHSGLSLAKLMCRRSGPAPVNFVMTDRHGVNVERVHHFARDTFVELTEVAKRLHVYGAGQDLWADAFLGNVRRAGAGVVEMEIQERPSECMHVGFMLEVHDLIEHQRAFFHCPEDMIKHVFRRGDPDEPVAAASTSRLSLIAGRCVGKDDPIMILCCQSGLPAVGEVLELFANPHYVAGWMRGSHDGPLMPCALGDSTPARFGRPPRVVGMGFQLADGRLVGPRDMLGDVSFDRARWQALEMADYMRRMGPFEPGRLPMEDMEYSTMPAVAERRHGRWEAIETPVAVPA